VNVAIKKSPYFGRIKNKHLIIVGCLERFFVHSICGLPIWSKRDHTVSTANIVARNKVLKAETLGLYINCCNSKRQVLCLTTKLKRKRKFNWDMKTFELNITIHHFKHLFITQKNALWEDHVHPSVTHLLCNTINTNVSRYIIISCIIVVLKLFLIWRHIPEKRQKDYIRRDNSPKFSHQGTKRLRRKGQATNWVTRPSRCSLDLTRYPPPPFFYRKSPLILLITSP
jgi:hypothetical protein